MKITKIFFLAILFIVNYHVLAQQNTSDRIQNDVLGISFAKIGNVIRHDSAVYSIDLSSSESAVQSATAQIVKTNRLFVNLPGSYGGRVYFDSPAALNLLQNRIAIDSINTGQLKFRREYWAVYAGMGMWDCVINCYTKKDGHYYVISLVQSKHIGKPGEMLNGKSLASEELKSQAMSYLKDSTASTVKKFNSLLSSFRIQK